MALVNGDRNTEVILFNESLLFELHSHSKTELVIRLWGSSTTGPEGKICEARCDFRGWGGNDHKVEVQLSKDQILIGRLRMNFYLLSKEQPLNNIWAETAAALLIHDIKISNNWKSLEFGTTPNYEIIHYNGDSKFPVCLKVVSPSRSVVNIRYKFGGGSAEANLNIKEQSGGMYWTELRDQGSTNGNVCSILSVFTNKSKRIYC
ncbi:4565_t:CDS:2 [Acaulospora colombiana]|uniref:4565_t:CDS:1 n=1 Tax=Acaulospora colombiana TaxID=27376 RepID=A0ACA9KRD5_9GLOM|nr:4565_t:CDS:2 [Acaulospora colombiana]